MHVFPGLTEPKRVGPLNTKRGLGFLNGVQLPVQLIYMYVYVYTHGSDQSYGAYGCFYELGIRFVGLRIRAERRLGPSSGP